MSKSIEETIEGKWHETLQQIRLQLRRGMDGETSTNQRKLGLDYEVNFGVNLLRLQELAKSLPKEEELADLMWHKKVREMKLLSLMIRSVDTHTMDQALTLADEVETLEVAEQLVFRLFRRAPFAAELLSTLFERKYDRHTPSATLPYLLLNHLACEEGVTATLIEQATPQIVADFVAPDFYSSSVIYHALVKVASLRPDIDLTPLCNELLSKGEGTSKELVQQLVELAQEQQ